MKGIIVDDFELIIRKNASNVNELKKDISKLNQNISGINRHCTNDDFKHLIQKLNLEINQFKNVKLKIEAYEYVLRGVLNAYQEQAEELTKSINRLTP